jgi:hypothetical protein
MIENASSARTTHTRSDPLDFMAHLSLTSSKRNQRSKAIPHARKPSERAWQLHQYLRGRSGRLLSMLLRRPAGWNTPHYPDRPSVFQSSPLPPSQQSFAFANGNPGVARNCCSAVRSRFWGRWLGRAGINSPSPSTLGGSTAFLGAADLLSAREIFRSPEARCDGPAPVEARKRSLAASPPVPIARAASLPSFLRFSSNRRHVLLRW